MVSSEDSTPWRLLPERRGGNQEFLQLLLQTGLDAGMVTAEGLNLAHYAARAGQAAVLAYLLQVRRASAVRYEASSARESARRSGGVSKGSPLVRRLGEKDCGRHRRRS